MIIRHGLRKTHQPRSGYPGRGDRTGLPATDVILVMMAAMLLITCIFKILQG